MLFTFTNLECAVYLSDETKHPPQLQGTLTVMLTIASDTVAKSLHLTVLHLQEDMTSGTSNISHTLADPIQHFEQALQMTTQSLSRRARECVMLSSGSYGLLEATSICRCGFCGLPCISSFSKQ